MRQLYTIGFTTNQLTDTVTTRDTECAACHESNAAGSLSSQAVKLGHGRSSRVRKSEGAKPRLKRVCGYTLPPSRFQRATSLSEGGSYAPFREGVNIPGACWLAAEGCRRE